MSHYLILFCRVLPLVVSFIGCTHSPSDSRPEGRVIEKSKATRPVWADAPVGQMISGTADAKIHYAKTKQRDLPIAIKLAQSGAVEESYAPWRATFNAKMKTFAPLQRARNSRNEAEYLELEEQTSRKVHGMEAQVEDIYYERVRIEDPSKVPELVGVAEYFDVHILVQLTPLDQGKLATVVEKIFSTAKSAELRKAAKSLVDQS